MTAESIPFTHEVTLGGAPRQLAKMTMTELAEHVLQRKTREPGWDFIAASRSDSQAKQIARERVFHLFAHRQKHLKILTLPSAFWHLEKQLLLYREHTVTDRPQFTYITSIEVDEAIFRLALAQIPGSESLRYREPKAFASFSVKTDCIQRFHRTSFEELAMHPAEGWRDSFNAAWLDFNGPIVQSRAEAIVQFIKNQALFPFRLVITALNGHYDTDTFAVIREEENRFDGIESLLREAGLDLPDRRIEEYAYQQAGTPLIQMGWDLRPPDLGKGA